MTEIFDIATTVFQYLMGGTIAFASVIAIWMIVLAFINGISKAITGE